MSQQQHHQYPGVNVEIKFPSRRSWRNSGPSYEVCGGWDQRLLPIREVFMLVLMDRLTDKPDWHKKVMDEAIVSKWRKEALEQSERKLFDEITSKARKPIVDGKVEAPPRYTGSYQPDPQSQRTHRERIPFPQRHRIVSEAAFDFCIRELRAKAAHFERTGLVPTLDAIGRAIAKSDVLVGGDLKQRLRDAFEQLRAEQKATDTVDWHPRTNEMVQDLVHPSLYPYVYGRSHFIQDEVVGVADAITDWAGKGEAVPPPSTDWHYHNWSRESWSEKYQWLPANLKFQDDGTVKFSSYVNNLHPTKHSQAYAALEKLIDVAIPAWDQVLGGCGRGTEACRFSVQKEADDEETEGLWEPLDTEILSKSSLQPTKADLNDIAEEYDYDMSGSEAEAEDESQPRPESIEKWRWAHIRDPVRPEPDGEPEVNYACAERIAQKFKETGLQVVVKMARIELTPEKPDFPAGGWHVEGMNNDNICATALYYLDSENITPSSLAFRMTTDSDQDELTNSTGQDAFHWLECIYGVDFRNDLGLQYYGNVNTPEGRLLAFPNTFQHRVTPFSLKDPTKPGHRSFVALWLIDPTCRIVSTANVPPQQLDWWAEAVFGGKDQAINTADMPAEVLQILLEKKGLAEKLSGDGTNIATKNPKLPNELMDMLRQAGGDTLNGLMSLSEAKERRLELMEERTVVDSGTNEARGVQPYSFCEH